MQKFGIGQPVPRVEDPRFITGRGRYVDDFNLPHQCHGIVVMSPHAHANIKKIDTTKAKAADGVLAVLTGEDVKAEIPAALDDSSKKKLDKLRDAKPEDFASEYDSMQVSAHKDAVSLFERYAKGGDNPTLKDWAGKTLPALQHHLEMAQALDKNRK